MISNFEKFLEINFDDYQAPEYLSDVEKQRFNESLSNLKDIYKALKRSVEISITTDLPLKLNEALAGVVEDFLNLKGSFDETRTPKSGLNVNNIFNRIIGNYTNFFELSSSNKNLQLIGAISNYQSFFEDESLIKLNKINKELDEKNKRVEDILNKLEKPSAERVLADYASEYAKEETRNNKISVQWLVAGIVSTGVFIFLIVLSILNEWFPSKLKLENRLNNVNSTYEIINVPVLVTKVMLVSLIIYFIIFAFRQYSINKHLAVVNQQKKNAFNSYTLFAAAVGEKDVEAKKVLLTSLARSIHESINTGFLSSKQTDQPLIQNVDLGKVTSLTANQ